MLSMQHNAGMGFVSCDLFLHSSRGMGRSDAVGSTTHFLPHSSVSTLGLLGLLAKYSDPVPDGCRKWQPVLAMQNLDAILSGLAQNNGGWVVPLHDGDSWRCQWPALDGPAVFSLKALCMYVCV